MDEQELLQFAQEAIQKGANPKAVDLRIQKLTGGRYAGIKALQTVATVSAATGGSGFQGTGAGGSWDSGRAVIPAGDAARMAAQGATFGFGDEIAGLGAAVTPGGQNYKQARDASRSRVERVREEFPVQSALAETAGGLVVPGLGGAGALKGVATAVRAGSKMEALANAGRVAATGAAAGGLFGIGESDEEDIAGRLRAGAVGATVGGVAGAALSGAAGAVGRAGANRARRKLVTEAEKIVANAPRVDDLAERVAKGAGIPGGELGPARAAAQRELARVSEEAYRPLEEAHGEIRDGELRRLLKQEAYLPAVRRVMGREGMQTRTPGFKEAQAIRSTILSRANRLERAGDWHPAATLRQAAQELTEMLERRVPGYVQANRQWMSAKKAAGAFDAGYKLGAKSNIETIQRAMNALPTEGMAREHFRMGLASRLYDQLSAKGGTVTRAQVERLQSMGMGKKLRMMFRDDEAYREFADDLRRLGKAFADTKLDAPEVWYRKLNWKQIAAAAAGGAGARGLFEK